MTDKDKETAKAKLASWFEVLQYVTGTDWGLMSLGTFGAMVTGLSLPFFYVLMGEMIDQLNVDNDAEYAQATKTLCFSFLTIGCINLVSGFLQVCCWSHVGEHLTQRFREQYVNAILAQEMGWFDIQGPGKLSTRVTDLTSKVQDGLGRKLSDLVQYSTQFVFAFVIAFYYNWKLTLVLLSAFPFIAMSGIILISAVSAVTSLSLEQYASAGSVANEALAGIRTLTALNAQPDAINRYRRHLFNAMKIGVNKGLRVGVGSGMLYGSMFLTYGLGFWYGAQLVAQAQESGCAAHLRSSAGVLMSANRSTCPTGGDILTVFFCAVMGSMALGQMMPALSAVTVARSAIAMMLQIINRKPLIDGLSNQGIVLPHKCKGEIRLRGVKFSYPARPELPICRAYDLHVASGETVALVGASGCGKSTIINLLLRFYDPAEGVIQLDGHNLCDLNIRHLRSLIGYVGQEPVLFAGTIGENIAHGLADEVAMEEDGFCDDEESKECCADDGFELPQLSSHACTSEDCTYTKFSAGTAAKKMAHIREQVIHAAKQSAAHDFICALPDGYDTDVGSNGSTLSGGQKQRIAIARALVKRPAVLLLDEATSALDATSERLVQQSIDSLQQLKAQTTIVIAHRLSTIRNADKICVVDDGRIVEMGTHEALLAQHGRYFEHVSVQMNSAAEESQEIHHDLHLPKIEIPIDTRESFRHCHHEDEHMSTHITAHMFLNAFETTPCGAINLGDGASEASAEAAAERNSFGAMGSTESKQDPQVSSRVWSIIRRSPLWLCVSLLGSAVFGAIFPVWGLMLARSQDLFYQSSHEIRVRSERQALLYIALAAVAFVSSSLQFYGQAQIAERLSVTLRSDLFEAFLCREIGFFDRPENSTANLTTRLANEPRLVDMGFGNSVARQVQVLSTLLISLVIGFTASWQIALVVIACLPLNICSAVVQSAVASGQHTDELAASFSKTNKDSKGTTRAAPPSTAIDGEGESTAAAVLRDGTAVVGGTMGPTALLSASFLNMRTVSALSMQHLISEQYAQATRNLSARRVRRSYKAGLGYGGSNCSLFLTYSLLFWYGSSLVKSGQISFADMMTAIFTMLLGALGIGQALMDMGDQRVGFLAAQRIFRTIDEGLESPIDGLSDAEDKLIAPVRGRIELKGVCFRYPTRPDAQVCEDYSLVIEPGEVIALVGPSGSGKSTIINLLLRFYDPSEGVIQLDGHNLCDLNIRHLRSLIGYVGQEPVLFDGTVKDNLARGKCGDGVQSQLLSVHETLQQLLQEARRKRILKLRESRPCGGSDVKEAPYHSVDVVDVDMEEGTCKQEADQDIVDACKHANAHDFIQSFPLGYDTDLGHGGMMVSGGQKQRIAIARALVKRPAVLLLDEATSALDATSERLVQQSIDALQQLKAQTTIIIAHRLSTIRHADKICVVDNGRIVETGKHEELLEQKGFYAQLWWKQCG